MTASTRSIEARAVIEAVAADLLSRAHRGVIVDSPPGAGKSTLVVELSERLARDGERVMIVAQTNEQVDDLVEKIAQKHPALVLGRLTAGDYEVPERLAPFRGPNLAFSSKLPELAAAGIVLATAAKWALVKEGEFPWAILDEAYQMRSDGLLAVAPRFANGTALFVGDPGQLDPFATVDTDAWAGSPWDPSDSAVAVVRAHNPHLPVHRLPYSWRLPATAAPLVAKAFYPFTPFDAGSDLEDRALSFAVAASSSDLDESLELAAETGWSWHGLPAAHTIRTDAEAVEACAALADRLVQRRAIAVDRAAGYEREVTPDRIAIGTAHRDQAAAVRAALARPDRAARGLADVTVDTANRLQGREYDVTIVLHPLSGRRDATAFHLETGRLCVLLSRHRHACIVVGRAGIADLLDAHPHAEPVRLGVAVKFPDGWAAHQAVLAHLGAG
ncbi:ATP-binding protein [Actinospica sp. MGRD01-02]|uniref:ATP-binding protein n=1 Tax=Actinospica acidithermotolerans TaxID=2828514 RepID=A0A941IG91_9ACTN|nr:AAA domain-containing protein [Actinospica acidithermotolerans]MBR7827175.1 ATP-binding protein [Actinospica acidithermotolerans]